MYGYVVSVVVCLHHEHSATDNMIFQVLACSPDKYKNNELLNVQIGQLGPDLWIIQSLALNFDVAHSLFSLLQEM